MNSTGNGYLSGNMLSPFPFEDGYPGVVNEDAAVLDAIQRCFVDAGVYVVGLNDEDVSWPSIGMFTVSDGRLLFSLKVGDSTIEMSAAPSMERFQVISGKADWGTYVVTVSSEGISEIIGGDSNFAHPVPALSSSTGLDGRFYLRLCARCVTFSPGGLKRILVYDGIGDKSDGPQYILSGEVSIVPGNNFILNNPDGVDAGIELCAKPGAGTGKNPCTCGGIGNTARRKDALEGHVRLFNDTCYDFEPLDTCSESTTRVLKVHAKCTACCTCEMYKSIVDDRLAPIARVVRSVKDKIDSNLLDYEGAVEKFNDRIDSPNIEDVQMSLSGMPNFRNFSSELTNTCISGYMRRCVFTFTVRNTSYAVLSVRVLEVAGTDVVVGATAVWSSLEGAPASKKSDDAAGICATYNLAAGRSLVITYVSRTNAKSSSVPPALNEWKFNGHVKVRLIGHKSDGSVVDLGVATRSISV